MSPLPTDAEALRASCLQPHHFVSVFDRHFKAIHRYVARRLGTAMADELTSETFMQAFEGRRFYEPRSETARPWLYGIASNLLREHRRKERRQLRAYARTGVDPVFEGHSESVERLDASGCGPRLAAGLATLNGREREAFLLLAWAELSYEEISEALHVPLGTVRSRLSRARQKMRKALEADLEETGRAQGGSRVQEVLP